MPFRPLKNAVVVRLHPDAPRVVGSIVIPDSAHHGRESWQHATVLAVGNGRPIPKPACPCCGMHLECPACGSTGIDRQTPQVQPGDIVLLERGLERSGFLELHEIDGEKVYVVPEEHIQVVVDVAEPAPVAV